MVKQEMINITAFLKKGVDFCEITTKKGKVKVANFALIDRSASEPVFTDCSLYGEQTNELKTYDSGDLVHVYGYYKERMVKGKMFENFIVKYINKIENNK